jgi:hypothetical protein
MAPQLAPLVSKALDTTPENGLNINPDLRAGLNLLGPENVEDYIELLVENGEYTEAVKKFMDILDEPRFRSVRKQTERSLCTVSRYGYAV